ncbi:MAG TPA: Ig-like domain-containing protein, partial [Pirellulaceae bacterium]|nr:Ig-like domain-containing protein [Pirellulaceae bacterium]
VTLNADGIGAFNVAYSTPTNQFITAAVTDASNTTYGLSRATRIAHIVTGVTSVTTSTPTNAVQPIQITANVEATSGTITGDVDFYAGNVFLGTATIVSSQAKLTTMLPVGQTSIRTIYKGTSTFAAAAGTPLVVTVAAGPANIPPTANTDNVSVQEDGTVVINVLTNDVDPDGGTLVVTSVVITQQPTHGTATLNPATGVITYKPTTNYNGPDTFRYTVTDNRGGTSSPGLVNITVNDIPEPWHNKTKPLDVDGDGLITPSDAVAIVNLLNFRGPGELAPPIGGAHPPYVDVDGDNFLSPTDIVLVINAINAGRQSESDEPLAYIGGSAIIAQPSIDIPESEFPAPLNITPEEFAAATERSLSPADTFAETAYYYQLITTDAQLDAATRAARTPKATLIDAALTDWEASN